VTALRLPVEMEREVTAGGTTYRLTPVRGARLAPLVPLFRQTYHRRDFTLDWLQRKYGCEYDGVAGFSCVAFAPGGEAVASVGMLPWPVRWRERTELAAQVVDAATHGAHRRRGLFTRLGDMAREMCESAGIGFLFAFPHRGGDSYPGFVRQQGFTHVHDLVEYHLPIHTLWAERLARRLGPIHESYRRRVDRVFGALAPADPALSNSLLGEGFAAAHRDRTFHAYKSFAGARVLEVDGGRVWLKVRHGLQVGDLEARSDVDMDRTLDALRRLSVRLGIHQIIFLSSPGTRFSSFFNARSRTAPSVSFLYRNLGSAIPVERLRFTLGDLDNF
jgi:GNAT superfamily N-acetyltransferase